MKSKFLKTFSVGLICVFGAFAANSTAQTETDQCAQQQGINSHWQQGAIEGALMFHPNLHTAELRVEVYDQRAQLSGFVDSAINRALAEQVALNVPGIERVVNQLKIQPDFARPKAAALASSGMNYRLSNVTISNKVQSQLLANRHTSGIDVEVETHNRTVILRGAVTSEAERQLAYLVVKNTQGVKDVVNQLSVSTTENIQVGVQTNH